MYLVNCRALEQWFLIPKRIILETVGNLGWLTHRQSYRDLKNIYIYIHDFCHLYHSSSIFLLLTSLEQPYGRQWQSVLFAEAGMFTHSVNQGNDTASSICGPFFHLLMTCSRPLDSKSMLENRWADMLNIILLSNLLELISFQKFGAKKARFLSFLFCIFQFSLVHWLQSPTHWVMTSMASGGGQNPAKNKGDNVQFWNSKTCSWS